MVSKVTIVAMAAFISGAAAWDNVKEDFPLVWLCLGLTIIGFIIAGIVVYRRPEKLVLAGETVMTADEREEMNLKYNPTSSQLHDDTLAAF